MELQKHELEWFISRVGKRVFRNESSCQCEACRKVGEVGLVINDHLHAQYLYDCQNELDLYYFDKQQKDNYGSDN